MKITTMILGLILLPAITFGAITMNLKYGQKNDEVKELQDFLIDKEVLAEGNNTGYFGVKTLKAVKQYQATNKIPSTGYVGNLTRTAINKELEDLTASSTEAEVMEVGTTTPIVSQPTVQYIYVQQSVGSPAPVSPIIEVTKPIVESITISEPVVTLVGKPNMAKYLVTFTVSESKKESIFTYNGTSTDGVTKGGASFIVGQPIEWYTDYVGTLNYKLNYGNGIAVKEGTIEIK